MGVTPDALVVFRGGRGTMCELAYAIAASKPLRFYDSVDALRESTKAHIVDGGLTPVLEEALGKYPVINGRELNSRDLIHELLNVLGIANNEPLDPNLTVRRAIDDAFKGKLRLGRSGFPGLSRETLRFERHVARISRC